MSLFGKLSHGSISRTLTKVLVLIVVATIGLLGYVLTNPAKSDGFTEFYILGPGGMAVNYPKELTLGDEGKVIVGVVNRENRQISYRIEITIDGTLNSQIPSIVLADKEKWEKEVVFKPVNAGNNQKVLFLLFEEGSSSPKEELFLWVSVKPRQ